MATGMPTIQDLITLLQQKQEELKLVEEVGKELVQRGDEQEKIIADLKQELTLKDKAILNLENTISTKDANKLQRKKSGDLLEQQYNELKQRYDRLQNEISAVREDHANAESLLQQKEKHLNKLMNDQKEKLLDSTQQIERLQERIKQQEDSNEKFRRNYSKAESERNELAANLNALQKESNKMEEELYQEKTRSKQKEIEQQELKEQVEEYLMQAEKLKMEHSNMAETITTLVKKNHNLHQENEELMDFIKKSGSTGTSKSEEIQGGGESLLSELEQSNKDHASMLTANSVSLTPMKIEQASPSHAELSSFSKGKKQELSEHDYFYLAAAAIKIGLILSFPEKAPKIAEINAKDLYNHALDQHIPFHEWHAWLIVEFANIMLSTNTITLQELRKAYASKAAYSWLLGGADEIEEEKQDHLEYKSEWAYGVEKTPTKASDSETAPPVNPHDAILAEFNTKLHKLWKTIPEKEVVVEHFPCTLETVKGDLLLTEKAMYFFAVKPNTQPKKIVKTKLEFSDIVYMKKQGLLTLQRTNSIYIKSKDGVVYSFTEFPDMGIAYTALHKLWNEKTNPQATPKPTVPQSPSPNLTNNNAAPPTPLSSAAPIKLDPSKKAPALEKFAITPKLIEFLEQLAQNDELFVKFPLDNWDPTWQPTLRQMKHSLLIQLEVPNMAQLVQKLCPSEIPENKFWRIYFELVKNRVSKALENNQEEEVEKDWAEIRPFYRIKK